MPDILIIEDELTLQEAMEEGLRNAFPAHGVKGVSSVEEAIPLIQRSVPLVVVSDVCLPGKSGIDFLIEARTRWPSINFVLISAFALVSKEQALAHGALRLIRKPFALRELIGTIDSAIREQTFDGSLEGISLVDLMQLLHWGKKNTIIQIGKNEVAGEIHFKRGEVCHAVMGKVLGVAAFRQLLRFKGGHFVARHTTGDGPETIHDPFELLLLEALKINDEEARPGEPIEQVPEKKSMAQPTPSLKGRKVDLSCLDADIDLDEVFDFEEEEVLPKPCLENVGLNTVCHDVMDKLEDALACGVVDLASGLLMGVHHTSQYFDRACLEVVAVAAVDLFRGNNVRRLDDMFTQERGLPTQQSFQEIYIHSHVVNHFMKAVPETDAAVVLVTGKDTNQGLGWFCLRGAVDMVKSTLPHNGLGVS